MSDLTGVITANTGNRAVALVTSMSVEELNPEGGQAHAGFRIAAAGITKRGSAEERCRRDRC